MDYMNEIIKLLQTANGEQLRRLYHFVRAYLR